VESRLIRIGAHQKLMNPPETGELKYQNRRVRALILVEIYKRDERVVLNG
jgi:hypothetical protein